jgi:AraC-like DNA-binding protein
LTETRIAHRQRTGRVICWVYYWPAAVNIRTGVLMQPPLTTGTDTVQTAAAVAGILSTGSVPEPDRLDFWRDVVCRTIAGVEATALDRNRPYRGWIRTQSIPLAHLADFDVIEVEADAQLVSRTSKLIGRSDGAWLLMIQQEGHCEVGQGERKTTLVPGDIGFLDTSRPYDVAFPVAFRQSILKMPALLFRDLAPRGADLAGFSLPGGQALTAIARQNLLFLEHATTVVEPAFLPAAASCAIGHLALAMRATLRGMNRDHAGRTAADHVARADAFIADHLHDAELSVEQVARSIGISSGHLQQLYRTATELTVAHAIRERRLAACRRQLADPSLIEESITSIAFRWGFSESSSFSRAFRKSFGTSPRQYRNHCLASKLPKLRDRA